MCMHKECTLVNIDFSAFASVLFCFFFLFRLLFAFFQLLLFI